MIKRTCCFLLILLHAADSSAKAIHDVEERNDNSSLYRLPKDVLPESYDLLLLTNVTRGDFKYSGVVKVHLKVVNATNKIVVHAEKLNVLADRTILQKLASNGARETVITEEHSYDEETQLYAIRLSRNLPPGKYLLTLGFVGEVLDDIFGFYRSSYRVNNETRWIGVTQFSPTFARRAFPCMDEPGFKATFQLSLGHYENETVTSNTLVESRNLTDRPGYYITRFSRTPRMSTYLLGWSIHSFKRVNSSDPRIWLWSRFDGESLPASSVLVEGPAIYSALERWMLVENPVRKIEHFAVPDFNFNAMENWGFITFRESVPLAFDGSTPLSTINDNLMTLGHEYAHTWFGNLVTPSFWNYAWLKEGFATYFSYMIIASIHEDWRTMNLFSLENLQDSMLSDSADHNRTMNGRSVGSPKSAKAALDFVTYKKAASIIRMTSDVLGEPLFQNAMHSYLRERQYEAATPSDLYRHLEAAVNSSPKQLNIPVTIGAVMESWANQPNYPLIRVSRVSSQQIRISQELFMFNRSKVDATKSPFWWVPVKFASPSKNNAYQLVETLHWLGPEKSKTIELPIDTSSNDWFILNPHLKGFYRVDYDNATWDTLQRILNSEQFKRIPAINRAGIIDDAFNLARADFRSYELALKLSTYLLREDEYEPWVAANRAILLLNEILSEKTDVFLDFRRFAARLITPVYQKLGFKESSQDSRINKMLRATILSLACTLDIADCVSTAKSMFDEWINDENISIPANFKSLVYNIGVKYGTDADWIKLWQRFIKTDMHVDKVPLISALAFSNNSSFIELFLEFSIQKDSDLAKQYRLSIPQKIITKSNQNIETTLKYVEKNINKIIRSQGTLFLEGILSAVGRKITTKEQLKKISQFLEKNASQLGNAVESGRKAIKEAENKIIWVDRCAIQVQNFLSN